MGLSKLNLFKQVWYFRCNGTKYCFDVVVRRRNGSGCLWEHFVPLLRCTSLQDTFHNLPYWEILLHHAKRISISSDIAYCPIQLGYIVKHWTFFLPMHNMQSMIFDWYCISCLPTSQISLRGTTGLLRGISHDPIPEHAKCRVVYSETCLRWRALESIFLFALDRCPL